MTTGPAAHHRAEAAREGSVVNLAVLSSEQLAYVYRERLLMVRIRVVYARTRVGGGGGGGDT